MVAALIALEQMAQDYDNGDIPPTFTLTLTEDELTYLHEVLKDETLAFPEIPELHSLYLRVNRLMGVDLNVIN